MAQITIKPQRRSTEAPNGGVFKMWIERGPRTGPFLSLASRVPAEWSEPETIPVRGTRLIARGVNPTFHHQSVIFQHQLTRFVSFYMNSLYFNKEYHCNKNGAKRSSSWPGTPFWPIPLRRNQQKGRQKGWNTKFHQIRFSASQTIPNHKRSTPVVFWGEKRPWVERGGSLHKYSVPKNKLIFCPDHWGGPFRPKLCGPSTYLMLYYGVQEAARSTTFGTPLSIPLKIIYPKSWD